MHIHPFPARMAPELVLRDLERVPKSGVVLDPMAGSGMVLRQAAKKNIRAIGYDLDPLARLVAKVNSSRAIEKRILNATNKLLARCEKLRGKKLYLPWIDNDEETRDFINYWFGRKQQNSLRPLSYFLVEKPFTTNKTVLNVLKVAVSRLIITKEPKASLAMDTAHSRPHKVMDISDFDIFAAIPQSVRHVLRAMESDEIKQSAKIYQGDARSMGRIGDLYVDQIITSPPYLNAIDYMRGHRMSLVWLGYRFSELRKLRSKAVGAEAAKHKHKKEGLPIFFRRLPDGISEKKRAMLNRYYYDLCEVMDEAYRVLKRGGRATYVIGDSTINGHEIRNSELLMEAAYQAGFEYVHKRPRDIPENLRYMPLLNDKRSDLSKRMRSEHIIKFRKP